MKDQAALNARHQSNPHYLRMLERLPKPGAKLRYKGTNRLTASNIIENAETRLQVGEIYTLKTIEIFSSWTAVTLEGFDDLQFCLSFFERLPASSDPA